MARSLRGRWRVPSGIVVVGSWDTQPHGYVEPQASLSSLCVCAGPGGPPADGWSGGSHGRGLAPGEPTGRLPALPVPGLAGLCGHAQLLRLAGQPGPQPWPSALGMKAPRPPRTAAAAGQALLVVVAPGLSWPPGCLCVRSQPRGHQQFQRCSRPSPHPRNRILCFLHCSKLAVRMWNFISQIKFFNLLAVAFLLGGDPWPWGGRGARPLAGCVRVYHPDDAGPGRGFATILGTLPGVEVARPGWSSRHWHSCS